MQRPIAFYYGIIAIFLCGRHSLAEALQTVAPTTRTITVTTRTMIPDQSPAKVQEFLASPGNWPKIVSTSMGVKSEDADVSKPLPVGKTVDEIFGLPPILPLSVTWTCTKSTSPLSVSSKSSKNIMLGVFSQKKRQKSSPPPSGRLEYFSAEGLKGVAENCEMVFDVTAENSSNNKEGTQVVLNMKYQPVSPLAILAVPILTIDNALALQFLLPAAMRKQPELDKFRNLMGALYGGAGLAHFADCVLGDSQLLTMAGSPTFAMLPLPGQLYALLWCFMGPLAFALTKFGGGAGFADMGLILYGLVEVVGAGLIVAFFGAGSDATITIMDPFLNAVLVQAVVAGAWFFSANKEQEEGEAVI